MLSLHHGKKELKPLLQLLLYHLFVYNYFVYDYNEFHVPVESFDLKDVEAEPEKYINLSGEVIKDYVDYFKIPIENILIINDDMDLEIGAFKLREQGSSAGHNGLKNIEANLGTNHYKRIKVGISKDKTIEKKDYVLGHLSQEDLLKLEKTKEEIKKIYIDFFEMSFSNLMNKYNIGK